MPRYFWCHSSSLRIGAFNLPAFGSRIYQDATELFEGNWGTTYVNDKILFMADSSIGSADEQRTALAAALALGGLTALPPGFSTIGKYAVIRHNTNGLAYYTSDGCGPVLYSMAELADYVEPMRDTENYTITCVADNAIQLDQRYMPPIGELVGSAATAITAKTFPSDQSFRTCGHCGRTGHDTRTCAHTEQVYDKIGVELEGRWIDLNAVIRRARADGLTAAADGSVNAGNSDARAYEIQTKPGSLGQTLSQVVKYYPDEADKSCGMHVHVSFKQATDFTCLSSEPFFAYFKERWETWGAANNLAPLGEFFARLRGANTFCRPNTETPARLTNTDRYFQLNFSAYGEHKTVECRLLPMFVNQALSVSAIQELIDIYQVFLASPEAYGLTLPEQGIDIPAAEMQAQIIEQELEVPVAYTLVLDRRELELEDILPPAPGMLRVAIPGGRFDMAMLRKIAELQKARVA